MTLEKSVLFLNGFPSVRYMYLGNLTLEFPLWKLEYQIDLSKNKRGGFYRFKMILERTSLSVKMLPAVAKKKDHSIAYKCSLRSQIKLKPGGITSSKSNLFCVVSPHTNKPPIRGSNIAKLLKSIVVNGAAGYCSLSYYTDVYRDFQFLSLIYGGVQTDFFPETSGVWAGSSPRLNTAGRYTHKKKCDDAPAAHTKLFLYNLRVGRGEGVA